MKLYLLKEEYQDNYLPYWKITGIYEDKQKAIDLAVEIIQGASVAVVIEFETNKFYNDLINCNEGKRQIFP